MSVSGRLWLVLMDREWHHTREFLSFLKESVDPTMAARSYAKMRRRGGKFDQTSVPVEHMVMIGRRRVVMGIIGQIRLRGFIIKEQHGAITRNAGDEGNDDFSLQLTDAGWAHLTRKSSETMGHALKTLRALLCRGAVSIRIQIADPDVSSNG